MPWSDTSLLSSVAPAGCGKNTVLRAVAWVQERLDRRSLRPSLSNLDAFQTTGHPDVMKSSEAQKMTYLVSAMKRATQMAETAQVARESEERRC